MKTPHPTVTRELKEAVAQLHQDYAEVLDDLDISAWPEFFTDDCTYVVTSRENYDAGMSHGTIYCEGIGMVRDRARSTLDCTVYEPRYVRHFIDGIRITGVDGDTIRAKARFLVIESVSDQEPYVLAVGQYIDTIVQREDGLKLKSRHCVYDNYRIYNTLVFPV